MQLQLLTLLATQVAATCPMVKALYNVSECCSDAERSVPAHSLATFVTEVTQVKNHLALTPTFDRTNKLLHYRIRVGSFDVDNTTVIPDFIVGVVKDDPNDYPSGTYTPGVGPLYTLEGHNVTLFRPSNSISDLKSVGPSTASGSMHVYFVFVVDGNCFAKFEGSGRTFQKPDAGYIVGRMSTFTNPNPTFPYQCNAEQRSLLSKPFVWELFENATDSYLEIAGYEWTNPKEMLPYPLGITGVMADVQAPLGPFYD